jgi:hypothetical protein
MSTPSGVTTINESWAAVFSCVLLILCGAVSAFLDPSETYDVSMTPKCDEYGVFVNDFFIYEFVVLRACYYLIFCCFE